MKKIFGLLATGAAAFLGGLVLGSSKPEEVKKFGNDVKTKVRDFSQSCIDKISGEEPKNEEEAPKEGDDFEKVN